VTNEESEYALLASGLTKRYGSVQALDQLDLRVPRGGIHGFLGPNGSGKTTTIRLALGLARPDAGRLEVLGHDVSTDLPAAVLNIGAIVEQPKFFANFTARHNLRLLAVSMGVPMTRVDEVLELVGLADRARSKFDGYSLGMKQRLAIAATLLKDPELLIFDEPTNGLDPAGIQQIRATMQDLAAQGHTILMSSHILGEVEQVADTVSVIARGRLVAEGRLRDLLGPGDRCVTVEVPDPGAAIAVLTGLRVTQIGHNLLEIRALPGMPDPDSAALNRVLATNGVYASALVTRTESLEEAFLRLTSPPPPGGALPGQAVA
jgi:ABC-type multidrug transport system ATPase subunit